MRTNNIITKMNAGEVAYGCGITFPSPTLIELMAVAGFDFASFDGEHGPVTPESLDNLCRIADSMGLTPVARVPDIESSTILRFLDRALWA